VQVTNLHLRFFQTEPQVDNLYRRFLRTEPQVGNLRTTGFRILRAASRMIKAPGPVC